MGSGERGIWHATKVAGCNCNCLFNTLTVMLQLKFLNICICFIHLYFTFSSLHWTSAILCWKSINSSQKLLLLFFFYHSWLIGWFPAALMNVFIIVNKVTDCPQHCKAFLAFCSWLWAAALLFLFTFALSSAYSLDILCSSQWTRIAPLLHLRKKS